MTKDLNLPVKIFACDTHREASGLAMSSRNKNLSESGLIKASKLFHTLSKIKHQVLNGGNITDILYAASAELLEIGFKKIDYLILINHH